MAESVAKQAGMEGNLQRHVAPTSSLNLMKLRTFVITFTTYATFHVARKSFSSIKGELSRELWMVSSLTSQSNMYGLMDMVFLGFYAVGLYVSGMLGDRLDLRKFLAGGMVGVALVLVAFGVAGLANIHFFWFYLVLWGINGAVQSVGWPANVAIMSRWFGQGERGLVLGLWSSCSSFGNICGGALVSILYGLADPTLAWKLVMLASGSFMLMQSAIVYAFLVPVPPKPHLHDDTDVQEASSKAAIDEDDMCAPAGISFSRAWMIPGVASYAVAYACVKSVSYSLFFWVPYYLTAARHMDNAKANLFSILYDVGALVGSVVGGYVTDRMGGRRSLYIVSSLCLAGLDMQFLFGATEHMTGILLFLTGILMGGPEMLITTTISADLGTHASLAKNAQALATVTGIIDGTGSIGAALAQYVVGRIANCHSVCEDTALTDLTPRVCPTTCAWDSVFFMLQGCVVVGMLSLSGLVVQETRAAWHLPG
ncbi:hypothetical protein, variant [Aphanomyces astaci]|nr:hypothetical protein, variant [Aphanomyces astaci]ETV79474.1 hypothetical protein, variant [Aphanomyces astaci]|eukprot:XP_009831315.1 hypothetical protein, variant [Aphanomyces astaci]